MLSKPAIGLALVAVGASVYVKYYGFPDLQQQPENVQAQLERAASMKTSEPMVLILGYLLFIITAGAFTFEMGQAVFYAVKRYRWKPAELPPLQPLSDEERAAAAAAAAGAAASSQVDQQQQQQQQQQQRQQQPSPTDHDERRRRALEALQREHDEKAAVARELQKQQDAERAAKRVAAAAEAAAKAAAEAASQQASATAASTHWERWEQAMIQTYGADASDDPTSATNQSNAGGAAAVPAVPAVAVGPGLLTPQQLADLDASRAVRQQQDEEFQASLAADAQKKKERELAALLKRLKAALASALPAAAAAACLEASASVEDADASSTTLAIRVRLPDGTNAVRQFAGVQSFADVLDWVYALPGTPLLQPGSWGLASSFPRRQLAAAAGLWAPGGKMNSGVNFDAADLEECIEAGSSLGRARKGAEIEAGYAAAPAGALSLSIRPLVGEGFSVQVLQRSSVLEVKRQVEQQTGLLPEDQRLIFAGQVLEDAQTLLHYKITSQHTLQLAPRAGASSRAGSSSGGSAPPAAAAAADALEPPAAAAAAAAVAEGASDSSGLLVVSTVAQLREDVAHGASQLALYVEES